MIQDLAQYDLLQLIAGETWPEQEQAKVVIQFSRALSGFVAEKLNPYFKDEDTEELKKLLARKDLTPNEVIDFYKSKVPNLEETFGNFILEFKIIYLMALGARSRKHHCEEN